MKTPASHLKQIARMNPSLTTTTALVDEYHALDARHLELRQLIAVQRDPNPLLLAKISEVTKRKQEIAETVFSKPK